MMMRLHKVWGKISKKTKHYAVFKINATTDL